jgi:hypothetical protein
MLGPAAIKALAKELQELQSDELRDLGIRVTINEADVTDIQAEIDGPPGTPFEGGMFRMRLALPADFPVSPPKGFFTTKIWHPNVSKSGEICVNVLKRDWKPELGAQNGQPCAACSKGSCAGDTAQQCCCCRTGMHGNAQAHEQILRCGCNLPSSIQQVWCIQKLLAQSN